MTTTIEAPTRPASGPASTPSTALVAVVKTRPATVLEDYARLMEAARWRDSLDLRQDTIIKLNLSWTKYFPACSTQPWQLEGTLRTVLDAGMARDRILPVSRTERS